MFLYRIIVRKIIWSVPTFPNIELLLRIYLFDYDDVQLRWETIIFKIEVKTKPTTNFDDTKSTIRSYTVKYQK